MNINHKNPRIYIPATNLSDSIPNYLRRCLSGSKSGGFEDLPINAIVVYYYYFCSICNDIYLFEIEIHV